MRTYTFFAMRAGTGIVNWPGGQLSAKRARLREVVVTVFRRWFGREPITSWAGAGMAQAWDERGNKIELQQWNRDDLPTWI